MRFSICVPAYNIERYLRECIDSILSQDFEDYELIIVDDGSTDATGKICDEYAEANSKIRVIHQSNKGLMLTRRSAIEVARGEYLLFVDSDDVLKAGALSRLNQSIEENGADLYIYRAETWYQNKRIPMRPPYGVDGLVSKEEVLYNVLSSFAFNSIWTKAVQRSVLAEHLDEIYVKVNFSEDMIQTAYILKYAESIVILDDILYQYRLRRSSMVHTKVSESVMLESLETLHKVEDILKEYVIPQLNVSSYNWENELLNHQRNALKNFLEHVYRNNLTELSLSQKTELYNSLKKSEEVTRLMTPEIIERLNLYNRYRAKLFINNKYSCLNTVDHLLRAVQYTLETIQHKIAFE